MSTSSHDFTSPSISCQSLSLDLLLGIEVS